MTSHAPPNLLDGVRVALMHDNCWREGTVLEITPTFFRVRYDEALPTGAWTALHGQRHDSKPMAVRIIGEASSSVRPGQKTSMEFCGGGVVIMKNALNENEQEALLLDCLRAFPLQKANAGKLGGKPAPGFVWSYGYELEPGQERPACLDWAQILLERLGQPQHRMLAQDADSRERDPHLHVKPLFCNLTFGRVWARLYTGPNALGWHRDPDLGIRAWVVNINLGADATFAWRHGGRTHRARLESGDAILFNGGQEGLEHAVEEVHESRCPNFWRAAMCSDKAPLALHGIPPFIRVGLQCRAAAPGGGAGGEPASGL